MNVSVKKEKFASFFVNNSTLVYVETLRRVGLGVVSEGEDFDSNEKGQIC